MGVRNHNQLSQSSIKFRNLQVLQQSDLGSLIMLSSCLRKQSNVFLLTLYLVLGAQNMEKT